MIGALLPLPPDAFNSGVCCAADPGPLCPGDGNYQREPSTLPQDGPQCVCYSNSTTCEPLERERNISDIPVAHGGRLVKYCSKQVQLGSGPSYNIPYFQSIAANGTGDIIMWAELQNGAVGPEPIIILEREYKTPTGPFVDLYIADDLNRVIQGMGEGALGTDLTLNWMCTGGPTGTADLQFSIQGGVCLRPRLVPVELESSASGGEENLFTCIIGKATPLPLGGCPSIGIFGGTPPSAMYSNSLLVFTGLLSYFMSAQ